MFLIKWLTNFFSKNDADTHKICEKEYNSDSEMAEDLPLTLTKQSSPQAELN